MTCEFVQTNTRDVYIFYKKMIWKTVRLLFLFQTFRDEGALGVTVSVRF
jgi:hypothetical protein